MSNSLIKISKIEMKTPILMHKYIKANVGYVIYKLFLKEEKYPKKYCFFSTKTVPVGIKFRKVNISQVGYIQTYSGHELLRQSTS